MLVIGTGFLACFSRVPLVLVRGVVVSANFLFPSPSKCRRVVRVLLADVTRDGCAGVRCIVVRDLGMESGMTDHER